MTSNAFDRSHRMASVNSGSVLLERFCTMIEKVDNRVNSGVSGSKPILVFEENIAGGQIRHNLLYINLSSSLENTGISVILLFGDD